MYKIAILLEFLLNVKLLSNIICSVALFCITILNNKYCNIIINLLLYTHFFKVL